MNYTFGIVITIINSLILILLMPGYLSHKLKIQLDEQTDQFYAFHTLMFYITGCLLLANTFALITGIYGYFILRVGSPDIMVFGRFVDRYAMFLGYIGIRLLGKKLFKDK